MTNHVMKLYPFEEVAKAAEAEVRSGNEIHQQFNCSHCGKKQTMAEVNKFFLTGHCEECNHVTDIEKDGCNFMVIHRFAK